jgi:hypothetical protein
MEAIKDAIVHLSGPEREELAEWLDDIQSDDWDRKVAEEFSEAGRGAQLLDQIDREIDAAKFTPLDEGLRQRRERRTKP